MASNRPYQSYGYSPGRTQHVEDLIRAFPAALPVNSDRSVIDVPMEISNGRTTLLRVSLPPGFPQERPLLSVSLPLGHPAVDSSGRLRFRSLDEWGVPGSEQQSLQALVREAISMLAAASLQTGPGPTSQPQSSQQQRQQHNPNTPNGTTQNGLLPASAATAAEGFLLADTKTHLQQLPTTRLEELLVNDAALKGYIAARLATSQAVQGLEALHDKNAALASSNIELESTISQAKGHVAIVRSSDFASARSLFDGLYSRHQAVLTKLSPEVLLGQIRADAEEVDQKSDELIDFFNSGATGIDAFVEQYRVARMRFHVLDIKRQAAEQSGR